MSLAFQIDWQPATTDRRDGPHVELYYPRVEGSAKVLHVDLCDVRAADGLRISYDFERDGWKIEQASVFEWEADDEVCDAGWEEVAFIKAWARQRVPPPEPTP